MKTAIKALNKTLGFPISSPSRGVATNPNSSCWSGAMRRYVRMNRNLMLVAVGLVAAGVAEAQQSQLSVYNLIVRNNLQQANHVYGSVVAQNITMNSGVLEIGTQSGPNNSYNLPVIDAGDIGLAVGGNIASGSTLRLMRGSAYLDNGSSSAPSSGISLQQPGNIVYRASPAGSLQSAFDAVFNSVVNEASTYANRANNATYSTSGSLTTFNLASTSSRNIVFNLTESQASTIFMSQNAEVKFDLGNRSVNSIDSIIVNIAGFGNSSFTTSANFLGSITSDVGLRQRLLWNFYQNDNNVALNRNWYGSILAPYATLTGNSNLDGSAAVNNINFTAEIHGPTWTGVPEPSTYAAVTFVAGIAGLTIWKRRKAAAVVAA
jgi:choice-of-anchor A domain-containing protein